MKAFKIIIIFLILSVIGFFIWKWVSNPTSLVNGQNPSVKIKPKSNPFTEKVEHLTDSLQNLPDSTFCQQLYRDIQYIIDDNARQNLFGDTQGDNEKWKELLTESLYTIYTTKLINQSMFVFNNHEWKNEDLKTIRSERDFLIKSPLLQKGGSAEAKLNEIDNILKKYYETWGFVKECEEYSYSNSSINQKYPNMDEKMSKLHNYKKQKPYNCAQLKARLDNIPQLLFNKHVEYIKDKINKYGPNYKEYEYQVDYNNQIYTHLDKQISTLNNNIYKISQNYFDAKYHDLKSLLNSYNKEAFNYYKNKQ